MHELSIAHRLVEAAAAEATRRGARRVQRLELVLGALAGVEPEALRFCFPMACHGTVCEGARLEIQHVTATGSCEACGTAHPVEDVMDECPACGHWPLSIAGGREMMLKALELELEVS